MGEVFAGRYELADPIGRGGVGAVWRAWDHRRRRYVAAKVLQQSDAHSLLRFVREQALRIDHPHVLAPASWAADDDKVLFTMDLVGGGSLVHLVGDYGPLPPVFVCTLLDQLLSGLAAVHAEGVVHRDIKPANVLLEATGTSRPRLRLSDFGIAMRFGEPRLTETNLVVGTPGYLAPEQLLGSEPDFPADLFAVGLVALYLLEGAKPDAKALVRYFTEHGTPGPPKGVPDPLWQIVATLLQPDPASRFRTATGARKALASAVELLPEPGPDDESIEIFDQLGPLPPGFGPGGPLTPASGTRVRPTPPTADTHTGAGGDGTGSSGAERSVTGSMSDTGSFHLPPPRPTPSPQPYARHAERAAPSVPRDDGYPAGHSPTPVTEPAPHPAHASAQRPEPSPGFHAGPHPAPPPPKASVTPTAPTVPAPSTPPGAWPRPRADTSTASYTAEDPRVPPPARPAAAPSPGTSARRPSGHGRRARRAVRRPGPPARAVIPILLLALVCYAVGFWALARV
ncbi:serine/threonine-protein kinase [Streptomyces cellostaticus]|uniref:serine/threonine-protein kinase n=1 Tax=Streptomyces cellostaticus TaxID=67285 RepID=UPI002026FB98|nr:serine/threonine protein kinase [Streptomyces cellostaticus]